MLTRLLALVLAIVLSGLAPGTPMHTHLDAHLGLDAPLPRGGPLELPGLHLPAPGQEADGRPAGYGTFSDSGAVLRVRPSDLPLRVYSDDPAAARVVARALASWNDLGRDLGLGPLFIAKDRVEDADFTIDWSGRGLPMRAAGLTRLRFVLGTASVDRIMMRPLPLLGGQASEVLAHELGHALGLGHSQHRPDLMHARSHGSWGTVPMTRRDRQMLQWVYSRSRYTPIVARRAPAW